MKQIIRCLLVASTILLTTHVAMACSCPTVGVYGEDWTTTKLRRSAAAFTGTVIEIKGNSHGFRTTFKIAESWKRRLPEEIMLFGDGSSCEYGFALGVQYLVFTYEADGRLATGSCSGNVKMEKAGPELSVLGKGMKPRRKRTSY